MLHKPVQIYLYDFGLNQQQLLPTDVLYTCKFQQLKINMTEILRISQEASTLWIKNPWRRRLGNWISYPWCLVEAARLEISCRIRGSGTCWCRRTRCRRPVQQEEDDTGEQLSSREERQRDRDLESSGGRTHT